MKTIRTQITFSITVALAVILIVLYLFVWLIIHYSEVRTGENLSAGFSKLEMTEARRNVNRVKDALRMYCRNLSVKASDWSQWDDTYRYVYDHNDGYEISNFSPEGLFELQVNMVVIVDTIGEIVSCIGLDLEKREEFDILPDVKKHLAGRKPFRTHAGDTGVVKGLLMLPNHVMMVTSRPILTSTGAGPSRGSLLFGRYLDARMFKELSELTHLTVNCFRVGDSLPEMVAAQVQALEQGDSIRIVADSDSVISGFFVLKDLYGTDAVCLHMTSDRDIHRQAGATLDLVRRNSRITFLLLVISIVITGITLGIVIIAVMNIFVIRRIDTIAKQALEIGEASSFAGRLPVSGGDEIASLTRSINGMLDALEFSVEIIRHRDEEAGAIMAGVPIGLCSLDQSMRIKSHYSQAIHSILGVEQCAGKTIGQLLGIEGEEEEDLLLFLELLKKQPLSYREMTGLNPCCEMHYVSRGREAWLQVQFHLMDAGQNNAPDILVVIEDRTEEKLLTMKVDAARKENVQLKMVAENPDLYREFLSESKRILFGVRQQVKALTTGERNRNEINAIYRGVHTIKGVSATFGLEDVTHITGELEDLLSQMMKAEALNASDRDTLSVLIDRVVGAFDGIVILTHGLLGDFTDGEDVSVRVPVSAVNETITSIRETVRDLFGEEGVHAAMKVIAPSIHRLKRVPVKRAFARSLRIVPGLIERLEKNCRLIVNGSECMVNYEAAVEVNGALVHLLRNAIDHGIEHPDERAANGKDPEGKVTLSISCSNEYLSIVLSDDGRGLDKEKLKAAARSGKMYSDTELENMTETELYRLALTPGFTTATHISDVSGRGVGLDAALSLVEGMNGSLSIESTPGRGTSIMLKIPESGIWMTME